MSFYKKYNLMEILNNKGITTIDSTLAIPALYEFFTENSEFDCLDFVLNETSNNQIAIATKNRIPRITDETLSFTYTNSYMVIGVAYTGSIMVTGLKTLSDSSNSHINLVNCEFVFVRNNYDECMFNFIDTSSYKNKAFIFAETVDGTFGTVAFNSFSTYNNNNCVIIYGNNSVTKSNMSLVQANTGHKYLLPLVAITIFKRVYQSLNLIHDKTTPYAIGGKQYFDTGEVYTDKNSLALLYL